MLKQIHKHQLVTVLALIIMGYVGFLTLQIISRNYSLQQKVDNLDQEIQDLKNQNKELEYKIAYYDTDAFVEKEARAELNMQAPGEHVVIFPDKIPTYQPEESIKQQQQKELSATEKFNQWLYFLFKIKQG